ncbi:hypothetical protein A2662_02025 [Candidatus Giovannonibacteria bacterium RIFCSPHIGHO2_01_FULL_45_33]|nr:MAG: hypothetical protein A2662_02025 [Candidatus Giovannonibacteria bacterium RIFCSPHIGHO2_01_FULL_45_33]OGF70843.1 MAG: hypothetical protein A3C73_00220 [Candidatus Giovannonibacteria bacterium RIFCSPHIGHO2_02_FULL_44_11]
MKKTIFILGLSGLVFAGYLSAIKLFNEKCAFNEACPYFLGYPACYYGFVMYLAIAVLAGLLVLGKWDERKTITSILAVSFLGIIFAGYFTVGELPVLFAEGFSSYVLGLPTCALGLIFYIAIFISALTLYPRTENNNLLK